MGAWMKGILAFAALGAVVAVAIWLGSSGPDAEGLAAGSAIVDGPEQSASADMDLPEGIASEATSLAPAGTESLAAVPDSPDGTESEDSAQEVAVPESILSGRVIDTSGRPIENVRIVFHSSGRSGFFRPADQSDDSTPKNPETRSDARGMFELAVAIEQDRGERDDGLPSFLRRGSRLAAAHEGFVTLIADTPELEEGSMDLGNFTMEPGTRVVGRVVDESGRAIPGATVSGQHLDDQSGRGGRGMFRFLSGRFAGEYSRSVTGVDGRFLVTGLPAGKAELSAEAEGRQMGVKDDIELEVAVTQDVGDITLLTGEMIAGFIVDPDGNPVVGASVSVSSMARIVVRRIEDMPRQQIGREMRLRVEADADGYFEMIGLGAGQYTVHVSAEGFARSSTENVATGTRDLSVRLEPLGELIVTVMSNSDQAPILGAEFAASARSGRRFDRNSGELEVVESKEVPGEYSVFGAGPSGTQLVIAAPDFATLEVDGLAVTNGGQERMRVYLVPESIIAGMVLDGNGNGIADARVRIEEFVPPQQGRGPGNVEISHNFGRHFGGNGDDAQNLMDESRRTVTDDSGQFEIRGVPAGDWEVTARAEDFVQSAPQILSVEAGQSQRDVRLQLDVGGAIIGHVSSDDGAPVGNVTVVVRPRQTSGTQNFEEDIASHMAAMFGVQGGLGGPQRATTKADGSYEVRSLNPGVYEVELARQRGISFGRAMAFISSGPSESSGEDDAQIATVVAGEETIVDIVQSPMASLEGRVVAGGEPVEAVQVSLSEKNSFIPFGGPRVETDRYGRYLFENVEAGEYDVSAVVPGAALEEKISVVLEEGRTAKADLVFGGATLAGRVVDAQSGEGARDVTIVLSPIQEKSSEGSGQSQFTFEVVTQVRGGGGGGMSMQVGGGAQSKVKTDGNGDFLVRFLKPGKYSIETFGGAYVDGQAGPIQVEDGESLDDVLIEVDRGATITGIVVSGETGQPLVGAPVSLSSDGSTNMSMTENGRFTFEGLDAGDYTIEVMGSGFGSGPVASQALTLTVGELREVNLLTEG